MAEQPSPEHQRTPSGLTKAHKIFFLTPLFLVGCGQGPQLEGRLSAARQEMTKAQGQLVQIQANVDKLKPDVASLLAKSDSARKIAESHGKLAKAKADEVAKLTQKKKTLNSKIEACAAEAKEETFRKGALDLPPNVQAQEYKQIKQHVDDVIDAYNQSKFSANCIRRNFTTRLSSDAQYIQTALNMDKEERQRFGRCKSLTIVPSACNRPENEIRVVYWGSFEKAERPVVVRAMVEGGSYKIDGMWIEQWVSER